VFNSDRFLKVAPVLFEDKRGIKESVIITAGVHGASSLDHSPSPRAQRFLSALVNTQHFHGLVENLDSASSQFFHDIIETFESIPSDLEMGRRSETNPLTKSVNDHLNAALEKLERDVPTYLVARKARKRTGRFSDAGTMESGKSKRNHSFTDTLLMPAVRRRGHENSKHNPHLEEGGVHQISIEYLVELEKHPWTYSKLFDLVTSSEKDSCLIDAPPKIHLKEALGEMKFK